MGIAQARARQPDVFFVAEAYDDDPAKVPPSSDGGVYKHEMQLLLEAGFDAVYDDPSYKTLKRIYEGQRGRTIWIDASAKQHECSKAACATPKITTRYGSPRPTNGAASACT